MKYIIYTSIFYYYYCYYYYYYYYYYYFIINEDKNNNQIIDNKRTWKAFPKSNRNIRHLRNNHSYEIRIILRTNTVINERTVMIKTCDASSTIFTMF